MAKNYYLPAKINFKIKNHIRNINITIIYGQDMFGLFYIYDMLHNGHSIAENHLPIYEPIEDIAYIYLNNNENILIKREEIIQ